ncbi:hypothetical protein ABFW14_21385 [Mycolicibacterium fortuitum]|uniref:hypothetical protein n=1 Tax=Mycolicibacterium TaxID=1866885 RepID=UPI0034CD058E
MTLPTGNKDLTSAWIYALNASLHEETPGPAELNIGSEAEPHMVSRAEAFRDLYAHLLLEALQADHARFDRLKADIDRAIPRSPAASTEAMWAIAAELCDRARHIIDGAGAADDHDARRRLLAGTKHLNRSVILGQFVPALQHDIDNDLFEELDHIDSERD